LNYSTPIRCVPLLVGRGTQCTRFWPLGPFQVVPVRVGKVQPYYIQHKRDEVQAFDKTFQELKSIMMTPEAFTECLRGSGSDSLFPSEIPESPRGLSIDGFCGLANDIAQSIKTRREHCHLCIYLFLTTP
jgi:hypothetical protein